MPKLIFRRSRLYDDSLMKETKYKTVDDKIIDSFVLNIKKEWVKNGPKILKEISKITKLKWREKEIVCYVSTGVTPYSDPLTLNLKSNIHTLSHELIHRILSEPENNKLIDKNWMKFMKGYKNELKVTRVHIVIHAIHAILLKNLFGNKVLEEEKASVKDKNYIRAWKIAEKVSFKSIVEQLNSGLR